MLAEADGAEIVVLRVAVNPAFEYAFSDAGLAQQVVEKEEYEALKYVNQIGFEIRTSGIRCYPIVREGAVAETILYVAEELHADLIAMSTHGRTGALRWILGSVADRVARTAPIPVLLIRPTEGKSQGKN